MAVCARVWIVHGGQGYLSKDFRFHFRASLRHLRRYVAHRRRVRKNVYAVKHFSRSGFRFFIYLHLFHLQVEGPRLTCA